MHLDNCAYMLNVHMAGVCVIHLSLSCTVVAYVHREWLQPLIFFFFYLVAVMYACMHVCMYVCMYVCYVM